MSFFRGQHQRSESSTMFGINLGALLKQCSYDTGRELRFKSTGELLAFLAQCLERESRQQPDDEGPLRE